MMMFSSSVWANFYYTLLLTLIILLEPSQVKSAIASEIKVLKKKEIKDADKKKCAEKLMFV